MFFIPDSQNIQEFPIMCFILRSEMPSVFWVGIFTNQCTTPNVRIDKQVHAKKHMV